MWQNGFNHGLGNLMMLSNAKTRSITAENVYGEKGGGAKAGVYGSPPPGVTELGQTWEAGKGHESAARDLGKGWKVRPCIKLEPGKETNLMDIDGAGVIQHIWMTAEPHLFRNLIVRMYWDNEETPSVEAPLGDFFCQGWLEYTHIASLPIQVNAKQSMHVYWPMPFRKHARITIENRHIDNSFLFFYTIDYAFTDVPADAAYFHAQFRQERPHDPKTDYTILDGIKGRGQYIGCFMTWQQNAKGWWGEGEFKAWLDGDGEYPTICGTGLEDYFGGAWGFQEKFTGSFMGKNQGPENNLPGSRHGMYRWHIMDPIRFEEDFRCSIQALGWRSEGRYLQLRDDISSVAYWYQTEPHAAFPVLGNKDDLEIV
ncbi:DUF2961 domain-containing protein [Kamptonema cortianum]|nr:glycoside hydrolase family 172 protein [Oscillatoria laete-virens]MDK3161802.1 DUF2961 domain-containing protein [Kamptonema cortianum]MDL5054374.1 DUF2961 domain-containing protein [Oscillatoria laete-virens NRMC-F 0139]